MPFIRKDGKIQVAIYFEPEVFQQIDAKRNPAVSRSEFYSNELMKTFGIPV